MAVQFTQELSETKLISAFNNNVVKFSSDNASPAKKAKITINGVDLVITPDSDGLFTYNFLTFFKTLVNENNFQDGISDAVFADLTSPAYVYTDANSFKEVTVEYEVTLENDTTETTSKTYKILRSVVQLEDYRRNLTNEVNSTIALLLPFTGNSNKEHSATYFEGYPFDVAFYSDQARQIKVKHLGTGDEASLNVAKGVNRIFISNGAINWSFSDLLTLHTGLNRLLFYFEGMPTEKGLTLNLTKKQGLCGVYLKWLNQSAGWCYYLFNASSEIRRTSSSGQIVQGGRSLENTSNEISNTGKSAQDSINLFYSAASPEEHDLINTIYDSPKVYRCLNEPFQNTQSEDWISETIKDGTFELFNKNKNIYESGLVLVKNSRYKLAY